MKNLFKRTQIEGFTLVELLAVIVILAIILVIAVPKIMSVIEDTKKATLETSAQMIAGQAEKQKIQNTLLGNNKEITCKDITNINDIDYASCNIRFDNNTAKVTIEGSGKFTGLYVCNGTKTSSLVTEEKCTPVINTVSFADDDWSTIVSAVQSGSYPYEVGDTKTVDMGSLGVHTLRVANTTKCSEVSVTSKTACGFVLEFADIIIEHEINGDPVNNTNSTNLGGWPASEMRTYVNETIYNALPEALKNGIINTYVVSGHGSNTTEGILENENAGVLENSNYWSNDKLYLLSTEEVWIRDDSNSTEYDKTEGTSRQLDYYATYEGHDYAGDYTGVTTKHYGGAVKKIGESNGWWWLRSAMSAYDYNFYAVDPNGAWNFSSSYMSYGVAPAFRLAE